MALLLPLPLLLSPPLSRSLSLPLPLEPPLPLSLSPPLPPVAVAAAAPVAAPCRWAGRGLGGRVILPPMSKGWFITFEGGEGTGKSTQIERLAGVLRERGFEVVVTREPGGTALAEGVRAILLDPAQSPNGLCELFLLSAARQDHVERVIRPALAKNAVVLCDRFADSSMVYQGMVRGVGEQVVGEINHLATGGLMPELTLVFDLDPEAGVARARSRNSAGDGRESRLDDEPAIFHSQVREGYLRLAQIAPDRVRVVDADGRPEQVFERLCLLLPTELR